MNQTIYEIYGEDSAQITELLMDAADISNKIKNPDNLIALKPNLVLDDIPENGAVTHPVVVEGCIKYLHKHGFKNIEIIESSWVGANTDKSLKKSGLFDICEKYNVPFYDLKKDKTLKIDTPFGKIDVCQKAYEADYLIDLPVLKGHCQTKMTCAIKNLKGCIPDREKRRYHAEGLMKPIAALATALKPNLVIVDSICGDLNFEEGGNPVKTNRMFLGFDALNIDAYGCSLMGLSAKDVGYLSCAFEWGVGEISLENTRIIKLNEPTASDNYPSPSGLVASLTKDVQADRACSACYASLVRALYMASKNSKSNASKIAIGQGWKGKNFDGLGIGKCASGAKQCVIGCPPSAHDIVNALSNGY